MPMEMLNFFQNLRFKKVVTIFTEVKGLPFADEAVRLWDLILWMPMRIH